MLADLMLGLYTSFLRFSTPRVARIVTALVVAGLSARFAVFAQKSARDCRNHTRPFEELAAAVRKSNPPPAPDGVVIVDRSVAETVPALYLEPAIQTIYCRDDVRVVVR